MKKLFCFLIVLSLGFIYCLPVSAISYSDTQNITNLLTADSYVMDGFSNSDEDTPLVEFYGIRTASPILDTITSSGSEPETFSYTDISDLSISWTPLNMTFCDEVYIYVFGGSNISYEFYINGSRVTANWTGASLKMQCYHLTFTRTVINDISVKFSNSSGNNFTSQPGVINAFTYSTLSGDLTGGWLEGDFYYGDYNDDLGGWVDKFERLYDAPLSNNSTDGYYTPVVEVFGDWSERSWLLNEVRLHLTFDLYNSAVSDSIDYATLTFSTIGVVDVSSAYVSSVHDDAEYTEGDVSIDHQLYYSDFGDTAINNQFVTYEANGWTLYSDLRGVDVRDKRYLHVQLIINPVEYDYEGMNRYCYFKLFSAKYSYSLVHDLTPTEIISQLQIISQLTGITNQTLEFFSNDFYDKSNEILLKLDDLISVMSSDPDQDEAIQGDKSTMQQQGNTVNSLNQTLDSVQKQDVDVSGMLSQSLNYDANALAVVSSITQNKYVSSILLLVFTLALVSYILFGKR